MNEFEVALLASRAGTKLLLNQIHSKPRLPQQIEEKALSDYQTDLDLKVEDLIINHIVKKFPNDTIISEERGVLKGTSTKVWYIDPIDGTSNLIAGRPEIAISIGLYEDHMPRIAVLSLPCRGIEIAVSAPGQGLLINGSIFRPPEGVEYLEDAIVGIPGDLRKQKDTFLLLRSVEKLARKVRGIRVTGALAYDLAAIALGELDARISLSAKAVDVAAGVILVREVQGIVTDAFGASWSLNSTSILAARSKTIHQQLLSLLREELKDV